MPARGSGSRHRLYRATISEHFVLDEHDQRLPVRLALGGPPVRSGSVDDGALQRPPRPPCGDHQVRRRALELDPHDPLDVEREQGMGLRRRVRVPRPLLRIGDLAGPSGDPGVPLPRPLLTVDDHGRRVHLGARVASVLAVLESAPIQYPLSATLRLL
jgi:hypothetical protein